MYVTGQWALLNQVGSAWLRASIFHEKKILILLEKTNEWAGLPGELWLGYCVSQRQFTCFKACGWNAQGFTINVITCHGQLKVWVGQIKCLIIHCPVVWVKHMRTVCVTENHMLLLYSLQVYKYTVLGWAASNYVWSVLTYLSYQTGKSLNSALNMAL